MMNKFSGNKRRMWALLALVPIAIWSYYNKSEDKKPDSLVSELNLTVTQSEGISYIYLKELNVGSVKLIDSIDIRRESKGVFYLDNKEAGFYLVQAGQQAPVVLLVEPSEKIRLELNARAKNADYKVSGSPGSVLMKDFQLSLGRAQQSIDSMKQIFESVRNTDEFATVRPRLDMSFKSIFNEQQAEARNFINKNVQSLASVYIINQRLGPQRLLAVEQDFNLFNRLDSALMLKYPTNKHALDNHARVSEEKRKMIARQLAKENVVTQKKSE